MSQWHHIDCTGECIACLIERAVQSEYGTQGLNYLHRHVIDPQREWQGLTDEEINQAHKEVAGRMKLDNYSLARAIESKLREKNNG